MSLNDEKDSLRRTDKSSPARPRKTTSQNDFGTALRSIYERTIGEDVPAEMLDLLNKLD